ncbi:unnamed protein product [Microthlaspi erraticum]|uniref:Ubiquitin-like protease family profile domain-containing protein n=1 Tax=Microthlaspi erraticum TaxID=1685480 RepID=A0A6D2JE67_9BRAS|nr:unnamed protein product [Microthlaspi erraticum]
MKMWKGNVEVEKITGSDSGNCQQLQMVLYHGFCTPAWGTKMEENLVNQVAYEEEVTPDTNEACQSNEQCTSVAPKKPEAKRVPQRSEKLGHLYTADPKLRALFASRSKPEYVPIQSVPKDDFKTFEKVLRAAKEKEFAIVTGHTVTNVFFLDIAKRQRWIGTEHMQVIMAMLWRRRGEIVLKDRAAFVDPAFTCLITSLFPAFKESEKQSEFDWGNSVCSFVDIVYVPMNWGNEHWVGLVIDLRGSSVVILDPFVDYNYKVGVVERYMEPVVVGLPSILKRCLPGEVTKHLGGAAYTWSRADGIYQNKRSGDCGPCAAKFLEMHTCGLGCDEIGLISDADVDRFREKYAMDCYEEFVGDAGVANQ